MGAGKESPNTHSQYTYYMVQNTPTRMTHEGLSTAILSGDLIAPLYYTIKFTIYDGSAPCKNFLIPHSSPIVDCNTSYESGIHHE